MRPIGGKTRLAGVIGWPIDHTLSPAMHNAAYEALGLDWAMVPFAVSDEVGARHLVEATRSMPVVGFSVTMPYKPLAMEMCDEVASPARLAGAVNTVHRTQEGRLVGYNTDGRGFIESLQTDAGFDPAGKRVALLGAGGAAGGVLVALVLARSARVVVVSRDSARGKRLAQRVESCAATVEVSSTTYDAAEDAVRSADLIVNATSVGMGPDDPSPIPVEWISEGQSVFDVVYGTSAPTRLVAGAREAGATAVDGLGMLVCQGATSIDIWAGYEKRHAPRDVMRQAALAELAARSAAGAAG